MDRTLGQIMSDAWKGAGGRLQLHEPRLLVFENAGYTLTLRREWVCVTAIVTKRKAQTVVLRADCCLDTPALTAHAAERLAAARLGYFCPRDPLDAKCTELALRAASGAAAASAADLMRALAAMDMVSHA